MVSSGCYSGNVAQTGRDVCFACGVASPRDNCAVTPQGQVVSLPDPAAIATTSDKPAEVLSVTMPFAPHSTTVPSFRRARLCCDATVIAMTLLKGRGDRGKRSGTPAHNRAICSECRAVGGSSRDRRDVGEIARQRRGRDESKPQEAIVPSSRTAKLWSGPPARTKQRPVWQAPMPGHCPDVHLLPSQ